MKTAIGILGDGQLAQMTCLAGQALGFEMHVYASSRENPAALVADRVWVGELSDQDMLSQFAKAVSVVTYDTELLPIDAVRLVAEHTRACPTPDILWIAQNRIRERTFLKEQEIPIPRVVFVEKAEEALRGVDYVGLPCVLKTAEQGYDGKGQIKIERREDAIDAWRSLGKVPCVLEEWVDFEREMSVIIAGSLDGELAIFPVIDNEHKRHILHLSSAPSTLPTQVQDEVQGIARRIAKAIALVGLLTIEMFYTTDGRVLVNELAPRPHNSGHHTQRSAKTSQFEQLCRAITGMPLGSTAQFPAAMVNLLGDLFLCSKDTPFQEIGFVRHDAFSHPFEGGVFFYGKKEARPGRKMGHAIAVAGTLKEAQRLVLAVHEDYQKNM